MPLLLSDYRRRLSSRLHRFRIALRTRGWRGIFMRAPEQSVTATPGAQKRAPSRPRPGGRRILIVDASVPKPDRDSGSMRALNLMRAMRNLGHAVDFLPDDGRYAGNYATPLQDQGIGVHCGVAAADYPRFLCAGGYDAVVVCRYHLAEFMIPIVRRNLPHATVVLDTVDLHHLREGREARARGDRRLEKLATETRRRELGVIAAADVTWVVSPVERELVLQAMPETRIVVVPNIVETAKTVPGFDGRHGLLFVGGARHPPNLDGVRWLLQAIFPLVLTRLPGCTLHVVGTGFPEAFRGLELPEGARIHGFVPDIGALLAECRVGLAPLRFGAGVKGKINASMAAGMPVVATACAAEGMYLHDGTDVLLGDDPEAFADAVVRLYSDEALWTRLSAAGLDNVQRHFSFAAAQQALLTTFATEP